MKAIITGSFDPVTLGHEDVIRRASVLFDQITVAVCLNSSKPGMFTPDQRVALLQTACENLTNVEIIRSEGLLADYCKEHGIRVIVRGIRSGSDLDYETALSRINRAIVPGLETVFLASDPAFSHISSNVVREMVRYRHSTAPFVSAAVGAKITEMLDNTHKNP